MAEERPTRTSEPVDRLTRLCDAMIEALVAQPENGEDVQCIVFLQDEKRGGLVMHGYADDATAMADLIMHLRAIFRANGKDLGFVGMPGKG
jgi:hypothetical protein